MSGSAAPTLPFSAPDPSAVCAIDGDRRLTWGEWEANAARLAEGLARLGVQAGDRVAVRLKNRLEWLEVSLALAKLGCRHVAMNNKLAGAESAYVLEDSAATAVIMDDADPGSTAAAWRHLPLKAVIAIVAGPEPSGVLDYRSVLAEGETPTPRTASALAPLVIYTSGTTGRPKGALLGDTAKPVDPDVLEEYQMSNWDDPEQAGTAVCSLVSLPLHHGAGPALIAKTLKRHGMVVLQRRFDAEQTLRDIATHAVTHWTAVPTMVQRVLNLPSDVLDTYDVRSLRVLRVGAAPVPKELKQQILARFPGVSLYEGYGCTEAGMITSAGPEDAVRKPGSAGRPLAHVEIRILDEEGRRLPPGETGEIVVRTPVIIRGYLGRPDLGPDQLDAEGFYHTGDIGHLDEEGYLYIYDRRTDMIIAGGTNIYPAEIEAVLAEHPAVGLVAVIGAPDPDLGEQPVAYVELEPGAAASEEELKAFCEPRLASYKRPRRITVVDSIPVNSMGKVLKRELRSRDQSPTTAAPRSAS